MFLKLEEVSWEAPGPFPGLFKRFLIHPIISDIPSSILIRIADKTFLFMNILPSTLVGVRVGGLMKTDHQRYIETIKIHLR